MKVTVTDGCISCGLCVESFPDLFHWNEEGTAEAVGQVPAGQEDQARQAQAKGNGGALWPSSGGADDQGGLWSL